MGPTDIDPVYGGVLELVSGVEQAKGLIYVVHVHGYEVYALRILHGRIVFNTVDGYVPGTQRGIVLTART